MSEITRYLRQFTRGCAMMGKDKYHPKLWKGPWVARGESRDGGRGRGGSDCWKEQVERNPGYTHRTPSKLLLGLGCTEPADLWMRKHVHMKYSLCSCSKGLNMGYASESSGELKKKILSSAHPIPHPPGSGQMNLNPNLCAF